MKWYHAMILAGQFSILSKLAEDEFGFWVTTVLLWCWALASVALWWKERRSQ